MQLHAEPTSFSCPKMPFGTWLTGDRDDPKPETTGLARHAERMEKNNIIAQTMTLLLADMHRVKRLIEQECTYQVRSFQTLCLASSLQYARGEDQQQHCGLEEGILQCFLSGADRQRPIDC